METIDCNEREEYLATLRERYPDADWDSGEWILEDVVEWHDFEEYSIDYCVAQVSNTGETQLFLITEGYSVMMEGTDNYYTSWDDLEPIDAQTWATIKQNNEGSLK